MATLQLDAGDVIKVVLQFLKENNLHKSFAALQVQSWVPIAASSHLVTFCIALFCWAQEESNVGFNAVASVEAFEADINSGKWDVVLAQVPTAGGCLGEAH
jgi:WD40 repeat-containing protein SMU1